MLETITQGLAKDTSAALYTIDYQSIQRDLKAIAMAGPKKVESPPGVSASGAETASFNLDYSSLPPMAKSFSPGLYEIEDFDEDESDDEYDDDSSTAPSLWNGSLPVQKVSLQNSMGEKKPPTVSLSSHRINLNLSPNADKLESAGTGGKSFQITLSAVPNPNPVETASASRYGDATPYDVVLSSQDIQAYLATTMRRIQQELSNGDTKRGIILLRDTHDLLEGTSGATGRKLLCGILDMVQQLSQRPGIHVSLVAACSPRLTDEKNLRKDSDFYSQLIDGNLPNLSSGDESELSIAADGTLFNSALDNMTHLFDKVEILPPSNSFHSLLLNADSHASGAGTGLGRTKGKPAPKMHQRLGSYLHSMENDMKLRVAEINCEFIRTTCADRGILIDFPMRELLHSPLHKDTPVLSNKSPLSWMTLRILSDSKVEKLLSLALGVRFERHGPSTPHRLEPADLTTAMKLLFESDISRCVSDATASKEIYPDSEGSVMIEQGQSIDTNTTATRQKEKLVPDVQEDVDKIATDLKRRGLKLNAHEKRVLSTVVNPEHLQTRFSDLILPSNTKLLLQTLITLPLLRPAYFTSGILSRSSINGVLLFGPPGTGKTMLAKAVAKSSGAWFMNVSLSTVFEKYVGEGEKNVRAIFSLARKLGGPCVIFLDEVDAVFGTRTRDSSGSSRREIMNEFMSEWDG
ncbi:hypothetical protein HDU91_006957, partial [Kappamyces sp. JEL0680]